MTEGKQEDQGDKLRDLIHYPAHRGGGGLSFSVDSVSRQREQTQDALWRQDGQNPLIN